MLLILIFLNWFERDCLCPCVSGREMFKVYQLMMMDLNPNQQQCLHWTGPHTSVLETALAAAANGIYYCCWNMYLLYLLLTFSIPTFFYTRYTDNTIYTHLLTHNLCIYIHYDTRSCYLCSKVSLGFMFQFSSYLTVISHYLKMRIIVVQ